MENKWRYFLITIISGLLVVAASFALVKQESRLSVDDDLVSIFDYTKTTLEQDGSPSSVVGDYQIDLSRSSATFTIITDSKRKVLASNAKLSGITPLPPDEIIEQTRNSSEASTFTWSPSEGIRMATAIGQFGSGSGSGFVIVGKSLERVDQRNKDYTLIALFSLLGIVVISTLWLFNPFEVAKRKVKRKPKDHDWQNI